MRIAINTIPLKTLHSQRGIGFYTSSLIEALKRYHSEHEYIFFSQANDIKEQVDIVHYPFFDPFFLTLQFFSASKTIVTVHDLTPIIYLKQFSPGVKGLVTWQIQKRRLHKVNQIITDSQVSKNDIKNFTHVEPSKVHVVHLAPDEFFKSRRQNIQAVQSINKKLDSVGKFILYVGDVNYNKNLRNLLVAFSLIKKQRPYLDLILVGSAFSNNKLSEIIELKKMAKKLDILKKIRWLGFIPKDELKLLYERAAVYVQPSIAEGFGLPLVEALACGCLVAASDISVFHEVAGEYISYFDPHSPKNISRVVLDALAMPAEEKNKKKLKGREWINKYSWKTAADQTLKVYLS